MHAPCHLRNLSSCLPASLSNTILPPLSFPQPVVPTIAEHGSCGICRPQVTGKREIGTFEARTLSYLIFGISEHAKRIEVEASRRRARPFDI